MNKTIRRAKKLIAEAKSIVVICHIAPDGDTIGSALGLGWLLRRMGKHVSVVCADPIPSRYRFLPGAGEILPHHPEGCDLIIVVDTSDTERIGALYDMAVFATVPVINIDHHITNTHFGDVNLVEDISSTAEIIYDLANELDVPLDINSATGLLTGLVTDTQCFRTPNVTADTLRRAVAMMEAGASLRDITELVYNRLPASAIYLWGQALVNAQRRGRILYTTIDNETLHRYDASADELSGIVNFLASTSDADVAVLFRERNDGRIEAGMRASRGWKVSDVALRLGGGGHPQAAGCILKGSLDEVREIVLSALEQSLSEQAEEKRARPSPCET
ncbi:MAG: bifunctional oligoribonuclease/PAP phosphatase NrnA [Chloroflexi bacterium]|nr:bifunctional oligoribonuclease/PAP phosphatase NrnA [Chloroflexota bacterium]